MDDGMSPLRPDPNQAGQSDEAGSRGSQILGSSAVAAYKEILRDVLDRRPSGMRRRLAEALGRNPSFISQISNPAYPTPIPSGHVETILDICHFSEVERQRFHAAYEIAHVRRARHVGDGRRYRLVSIRVPDFADAKKNRAVDDILHVLAANVAKLMEP
jgi:hypothetical protein